MRDKERERERERVCVCVCVTEALKVTKTSRGLESVFIFRGLTEGFWPFEPF